MWWKSDNDEKVSYLSYQVGETEVMVGPRLDRRGCTYDFFKSITGWLVVTESYIEYPPEANVRWFPWKEGLEILPDHALYGSLRILNYWVNELKLPKVYIHCDLGSHRAPTILGAFLSGYYPQSQGEIIKNRKVTRIESCAVKGLDGKIHAEPDIYFQDKVRQLPLLPTMVEMIVSRPSESLEQILKSTTENRPLSSYTAEEKEEHKEYLLVQEKKDRIRSWLTELGFSLPHGRQLCSFKDIQTPQGLSHVMGDQYFPEMLQSFKRYGRLYLTSTEGKEALAQKLPDAQVTEVLAQDDLVLYYYEFDLNNLKDS